MRTEPPALANIWRRTRRFAGALVGFAALIIGGSRCSDLTAPSQLGNVVIQFSQPQDTITAVVGDTIAPVFNVMIGAQRQERARYVYSVITANDRLRVIRNGEAIEVLDRGVDTIYARVVGVTIGGPSNSAKLVDTIYVIAGAADNRVSSPAGAFRSLGEFRDLNATSVSRQGVPVRGGQVTWESTNIAVVSVVNVQSVGDTSRARVRANSNGTAEILTIFENIDTVRTPVTVEQQFAKFRLVSSRNSGLTSIRFRSLTDTSYVHAFPQDSLGNNFVAGANVASVPTASFALSQSGVIALAVIDANTALMTSETNGIIRLVANGAGALASDSMQVTVAQEAVSLVIDGLRVDTIPSIGATREFTATALDALGRGLPPDSIVWASTVPGVASISGKNPAVARGNTVGTTSIAASRDSHSDTVTLVVRNDPDRVVLSPDTLRILSVNDTVSFTPAVVTNTRGDPLTGIPVTYHSLDSTIAQPLSNGAIWGRRVGVTRVFATTGGSNPKVDTSRVVVTNAPDSIDIVPSSYTFTNPNESADSLAVPARLFNSRGVALPRAAANWRSGNEAVARVTSDSSKTIISTGIGDTYIYAYSPIDSLNVRDSILVTFTAGAAAGYRVTASNSAPVAGSSVTIRAQLVDANNNPVRTAGNAVSFTSTNGGSFTGSNPATTDATGAAVITFNTATTVSTHTVTATTGGLAGSSTPITSVAAAANNYLVTPSTINPAAGATITLTAQLRDANGNAVATPGQVVAWTKSDASGAFSGGGSSTTNASGIATIQLTTHTVAGTATTVTATTGSLTGTSTTITTFAGAAAQLTLTQAPPATAQSGVPFSTQPVLQLRDVNGNPVAQANVSVVATITAGGGSLGGVTLVQTNASGVATFSDLSISGANGGRTLTFSASGVSSATAGVTLGAGAATQIAVWDGNGQTALAGSTLPIDPAVRVVDGSSNPVAGVNVTFTVTAGGGTTSPPSGSTVATDASGLATLTTWTLGNAAGTNTLTAQVAGLTGSPVTFTATGTTGPATQMTTSVGAQTAEVNTPVGTSPSVLVLDANNNPVAGVSVTFAVTSGGGVISSPTGSVVTTNASGIAALGSWTLGTVAGANSIDATAAGLPTVTFTATGVAGAATVVAVNGGNGQSAVVGTPVAVPPSATVRDAYNNPVSLRDVTFAVTAGGGTTTPATPVTIATNASGVAALTSWTLGTAAGTNTISATAAGLIGSPVTFSATGLVGVVNSGASSVLRTGGNNVTANGSASSEITVTLRDQYGNAVSGKTVSLARSGTTSVISAPNGTTSNALGEVRFVVTNITIETVTYTATANDPGAIVLTQTAQVTFVAGSPFMIANSGTSQNAVIGTNVAAPPAILVRDGSNNPLSGVNVTFTMTANGGGGALIDGVGGPVTVATNAFGVAALTTWTLGQTAGTNNNSVTATSAGVLGSPVSFMASGDNPDPDLTTVTPSAGVLGETKSLVLTGTGFISGSTVSFNSPGTGVTVNSIVVNSSTQLTANVTISPVASLGTRNVRVTNPGPGGGSSSDRLFTVNTPAVPTLTSLAPANGARSQTLDVVFTGTGFANGVTSVNVPAGFTLNSVVVTSGTQLTANITVGAATAFGTHNFSVTNTPAGGTSGSQTFTVDHPVPTLTGLAPATGAVLQTLDVVFTGTDFIAGVSSVNVGAGITVNSTTVNSATQLTANITITAAAAAGTFNFSVTNAAPGGGTSGTQPFAVTNPAPTLTTLAPASGERLQTLNVVFTGTGFISGVSTVSVGPNITVNSTTVNSATQLTANITIANIASTGARNFSVTNAGPGGGTSAVQSFTVTNPAPTLSAIAPTAGVQGQTAMSVVLTGTGFVPGSAVAFTPSADITINSTTVDSPTQITVSITIATGATIGTRDVAVTNAAPGGGTTGTQVFNINAPAAPTLTGIAPAAGDRLQTLNVVFTGTGFVNGVTSVNVPAGITINSTTVDSPTQITANLTIGSAAALGANSFTVTNTPAGGTSGSQTFTVSNPAPTITSVVPSTVSSPLLSPRTEPTTVITGTGFVVGTVVDFVEGLTVGGFTIDSPTQITVTNIQYPGTLLTTSRTLRVTNTGRPPVTHTITVNP